MEIKTSVVFYGISVLIMYIFLSDIVTRSNFNENLKNNFIDKYNLSNSTTHSFIEWVENRRRSFVAVVSATSVGILQYLPVKIYLKIYHY